MHTPNKPGFTLIELLVVITLIAIIAAILLPVLGRSIEKGEVTRAQVEMTSLASAIQSFQREYSLWPVRDSNGRSDNTFGSKASGFTKKQAEVMDILRAVDSANNPGHAYNSRRTVFVEIPESSMSGKDKDDNAYSKADGYYLDPWGNPYMICMDTDFDGEVGLCCMNGAAMSYLNSVSPGNNAVIPGIGVGIVSYGPNPTATNSILISWGKR